MNDLQNQMKHGLNLLYENIQEKSVSLRGNNNNEFVDQANHALHTLSTHWYELWIIMRDALKELLKPDFQSLCELNSYDEIDKDWIDLGLMNKK